MIVDLPVIFLEVIALYILKLCYWLIKDCLLSEHLSLLYLLDSQNAYVV